MKKNNEDIRQFERDGCVIIKVGDRELRKDRLDKISASLKVRRKKRQPTREKKHSSWNRPTSDVMHGTRRKSMREILLSRLPLICACCFFLLCVVLFGVEKLYYHYHLQEIAESEIAAFQQRRFTLAGYEIGGDLDSVDGYQKSDSVDGYEKYNVFVGKHRQQFLGCRYVKEMNIDKDSVICGISGFGKLKVTAEEYEEEGVVRYRIVDICLTANPLRDAVRVRTFHDNRRILEKAFGKSGRHRSRGERLVEFLANITNVECMFQRCFKAFSRDKRLGEKYVQLFAIMNLENNRMLYIDSTERGQVSVGLSLNRGR